MRPLRKVLKSIEHGLKTLTKTTQDVQKMLDRLEREQAARRPRAKAKVKALRRPAARRPAKATASDTVFEIIRRSRKGISMSALKKRTGYNDKKLRDIIYRLKKHRKVKSEKKGVYVKV